MKPEFFTIFLLFLSSKAELSSDFIFTKDPLEHPFYHDVMNKIYENSKISIDRDRRIVGGEIADPGQFPYTVGLHMRTMLTIFVCGGSLIKFNWVLTAAHCIYDFNRITAMLGTVNRVRGPFGFTAEITNARHIISHPRYNPSTLQNDIGLIFLSSAHKSLLNHPFIDIIALPTFAEASVNLVGRNSTVSGFGATSDGPNRQPSEVLRFVSMPIMSNIECRRTFGNFILDSNICVDTTGGFSPCVGDSGGPLTVEISPGRSVVVGVVSFGHVQGCGFEFPAVFARTSNFIDWIEDVTSNSHYLSFKIQIFLIFFAILKFF